MPPRPDAAPVAIPWFNNIWLAEATPAAVLRTPRQAASQAPAPARRRRDRAPTPSNLPSPSNLASASANTRHSSSLHTVSTMSAVDRVSLVSLPSSLVDAATRPEQADSFSSPPLPGPPSAVVLARRGSGSFSAEHRARQVRVLQLRRLSEVRSEHIPLG